MKVISSWNQSSKSFTMDLSTRNLFLFLAFYQCLVTSHSVNADDKVSPYQYFLNCQHLKEDWERFHGQQSRHPLAEPRQSENEMIPCRNYSCLMNNDKLDLEKLKHFTCQHDSQCAQNVSGMICSNHSYKSYNSSNDNVKFCSCPYGEAYSTVECRCKPAQLCNSSEVSGSSGFIDKVIRAGLWGGENNGFFS